MTFADYVSRGRGNKRLSKSELARRTEITPQYMTDIEKGTIPSEEIIERLVGALELDERTAFMLADKLPPRVMAQAKRDYYQRG